jgi:preprotein translocase subunit SecD
MKKMKALKRTLIILVIILLALISFGGIFIQKTKFVENILPEFKLGAELSGTRNIGLVVSTATDTIIYDKDGNVVEKEGEGTTKQEVPVNPTETLTEENYRLAKEVIEKRLNSIKAVDANLNVKKAVDYYEIKQNEQNGNIVVKIPENSDTDMVLQYMAIKGTFNVVDEQNNVLMNNSDIKKAQVVYNSTDSGISVYLTIQFNKEGTQKLKDISNTFIKTTDEEGKETTKKISIKIDNTTVLSTYFSEEISTGMIQLTFGTASSKSEDLRNYVQEANNLATLLNTGNLPIAYTVDENRYILPDISNETFFVPAIIVLSIMVIAVLFLIIKYRVKGILGALSFTGYIASLLIIIRLTNVVVSIEGMVGILISIALNYVFIVYLLNGKKKEEQEFTYKQGFINFLFVLIPIAVTTIIFSFISWIPIYSFGMTMFWGIVLIMLYNVILTKPLLFTK